MSTNTIMILLPGTTGSNLVAPDDKSKFAVWPLGVAASLKSGDLGGAEKLLTDTSLVSNGPILEIGVTKAPSAYQKFISFFESNYSFTYLDSSEVSGLSGPLPADLIVGFGYDWRVKNATSAIGLDALIKQIDGLYSDCEIFLVGHSMGGLVSRYYLESQEFDISASISGLITLGTPHLGSPLALNAIIGGIQSMGSLFFGTDIQQLVNNSQFPSSYELLPPQFTPRFVQDASGNELDIYSGDLNNCLVNLYGGNTDNFADNQGFYGDENSAQKGSLNYPKTNSLPYYLVVGIDNDNTEIYGYVFDTNYAQDKSSNPVVPQLGITGEGDGIVPIYSASFGGEVDESITTIQFTKSTDLPKDTVYHITLLEDLNIQKQVASWMNLS